MKPYLLDINVLVALAWPSHLHFGAAQRWFARKRKAGFRTCPLTQLGFVRISSNPKFTPDAVSPHHALALLQRITSMAEHRFWSADLPLINALSGRQPILGHRQLTDGYLLGLAEAHRGILATLDRGTLSLTEANDRSVELIGEV